MTTNWIESGRFLLFIFNNKNSHLENDFGDNNYSTSQSDKPAFRICCIGKHNPFYLIGKF